MRRRLFCALVLLTVVSSYADDKAGPDTALTVVTYNIRYASPSDGDDVWVNRKDSVADALKAHDVFGLQEATFPQINDLTSRLPDHDWYGVGRDDGKQGGEAAPIFYRRDRLDADLKGTIWLSETPEQVGSRGWDAALPRTLTWISLRDKQTGGKLIVANTHFDHRGQQARQESGKLVREFLSRFAADTPVLLMGDFNCLPDSKPYEAITRDDQPLPLLDARQQSKHSPSGPSSTWNGFKAIQPDRIIDHVFVRGGLDVLSYEVLDPKTQAGRFASDHLPIRVTIQSQPAK